MAETVREFINGCLVCKRNRLVDKPISLKGVLSKPFPFKLVSINAVGPLKWFMKDVFYVCFIDHASRFVVLDSYTKSPIAEEVIESFKYKWIHIFAAPYSVLTDRGSIFTLSAFVNYITKELSSILLHTRPYYPQGNAVNESSHRALNCVLNCNLSISMKIPFSDQLVVVASINNSAVHSVLRCTPYFYLFGMEPTLPGWQGI